MIPGHHTGLRRHRRAGQHCCPLRLQENLLPQGKCYFVCPGLQLRAQGPVCEDDLDLALSPACASCPAQALTLCPPLWTWLLHPAHCSKGRMRFWLQGASRAPGLHCYWEGPLLPASLPGGACLSWCPCGCPFPTCGPSINCGGDGCSAPGRSCSAHGSSSAPSPLEMKVGSENEETGNCQIPWQPRSGRSTLQNIYFFTFYSHCTVIAPEHLCQYVCKLADARHWMEFKGEGKGDLFCISQGLGGLWRTNQF